MKPLTLPPEIVAQIAAGRPLTISLGQSPADAAAEQRAQEQEEGVSRALSDFTADLCQLREQTTAAVARLEELDDLRRQVRQAAELLQPCGHDHGYYRCTHLRAQGAGGLCGSNECPHAPMTTPAIEDTP